MTAMQWITLIITWLTVNVVLLVKLQQAICMIGSAVCQLFGWTKVSKWFGTFAAIDFGRIIRKLPIVWAFVRPLIARWFGIGAALLNVHMTLFALAMCAGLAAAASCAPKNTIGATCPANAICDKVDFGAGAITVCLSPGDLAILQAAAARSRAAMKTPPDGGTP
jgi:hypothetical protein